MNRSGCKLLSALLFWSSLLVLLPVGTARAQYYGVTDLGTLGGSNAMAFSINNHEQIVGAMQTSMGNNRAFLFDHGQVLDLGTLGGSNSCAYGINDNGWMVGAAEWSGTNLHAFVCTNGWMNPSLMDLGTLGGSNSWAWMLDMYGDMVGWAAMSNGTQHAFYMTNFASMMDLGTAGGTTSVASCLTGNRMVVGDAMMSDGLMEPIMSTNVLFGSSSMTTMGMGGMGGAAGGQSWFINNMGESVGQLQMAGGNYHAFASGAGGMMGRTTVDLGTLGGTNSIAYCVNDAGVVGGMAQTSLGAYHAFMLTNALGGVAQMLDLNSCIPTNSGWELIAARGMNAAGQIVGWGMHAGHTNAFLLTPVTAPVMMLSAPGSQILGSGDRLSLNLQMMSSEPLTYQWLHDGMPIPGATNALLSFSMNMMNAGQYTVMARNSVGTVASASTSVGFFGMHLTNRTPQLQVAAPVGTRFSLESSALLGSGASWQALTNFTMTGATFEISIAPQNTGFRFYRALMVP